eukprot:g17388.t1
MDRVGSNERDARGAPLRGTTIVTRFLPSSHANTIKRRRVSSFFRWARTFCGLSSLAKFCQEENPPRRGAASTPKIKGTEGRRLRRFWRARAHLLGCWCMHRESLRLNVEGNFWGDECFEIDFDAVCDIDSMYMIPEPLPIYAVIDMEHYQALEDEEERIRLQEQREMDNH